MAESCDKVSLVLQQVQNDADEWIDLNDKMNESFSGGCAHACIDFYRSTRDSNHANPKFTNLYSLFCSTSNELRL